MGNLDGTFKVEPFVAPTKAVQPKIEVDVILLHKPRGSKGAWVPVENGCKLRVTKTKGKVCRTSVWEGKLEPLH